MTAATKRGLLMLLMVTALFARPQAASVPLIDNERVTVYDVTSGDPNGPRYTGDTVWISLSRPGEVAFKAAGVHFDAASLGGRAIVIDLKDHAVPPLANTSGHPNAFPRPGAKKLFENSRVVVWDYSWAPQVAMHLHDKDTVAVFVDPGALKSIEADGREATNEFTPGTVRLNPRGRLHTEIRVSGTPRGILTELK